MPYPGIPYLEAIATARPYRHCRLSDELTRPGTALLRGVLEMTAQLTGTPSTPPAISAWVLPGNRPSQLMFTAGEFERLLAQNLGLPQDVWLRQAGKLPATLGPSVYLPLTR